MTSMMEPYDQNASVTTQPFRTQLVAWKDLPGLNKSLIIREGLSAPTRNQREAAARLLQLVREDAAKDATNHSGSAKARS